MKSAHEIGAINRFIAFLRETRGIDYRISAEDVVVDVATGSNYDYQLTAAGESAPALAVEIFRLVESEAEVEAARRRDWLWKAIREEFLAVGLTDLLVHTPFESPVLPREGAKFAKALAQLALKAISERPNAKTIPLEGGFELNRIEGLGTVACGSHSDARWIDSLGIATPPLVKNLAKKDGQLAVSGLERIVLCINWASSVDSEDAAHAIALMDVSALANIDKVYFDSGRSHLLVYARTVREVLAGRAGIPADGEEKRLLETSLRHRLEKEVPGALELTRKLSEAGGGIAWLSDRHAREALVRAADKRVRGGDHKAGLWVVSQLRDDPDPPLLNYPDDPEGTFNYHEQIKRGEDPSTSVGVRAAVCWLIQTLICFARTESWQLIEEVERLAADPNLYVRHNACVPLIEFATRRGWIHEDGQYQMPPDTRARTRALAFWMLKENLDYPRILDRVARVFGEMPDLDANEAREVLETLLARELDDGLHSVARLLVFFAVFRSGHPRFPEPFDATWFISRLESALANGSERLRQAIAFTLFKTIEEDAKHATALKHYIVMLPDPQVIGHGHVPRYFWEMVSALLDAGPDEEVEASILKMISTEAGWSTAATGRFITVSDMAPALGKLAKQNRWETIVRGVESIAATRPTIFGGMAELLEVLGKAPAEYKPPLDAAVQTLSGKS
jgi:hypothetical protein